IAPPDRPYSEESDPVCSLNSEIESTAGTQAAMLRPRFTLTVLMTPSTDTSFDVLGAPFAEKETLVAVSFGRVSSAYRLPTIPGASENMNRLLRPFSGRLSFKLPGTDVLRS